MKRQTIVGIGGFPDKAELTTLSFSAWPPDDLRELALAHDAILVCGGNTANMLAVWRVHGFDRILREAWEKGIVLFGWSAGMICWFEAGVTDSFGPQLSGLRDGLGFLLRERMPALRRRGAAPARLQRPRGGRLPGGIALDDAAAARFDGTELAEVVVSGAAAGGYRVAPAGEEALPTRAL